MNELKKLAFSTFGKCFFNEQVVDELVDKTLTEFLNDSLVSMLVKLGNVTEDELRKELTIAMRKSFEAGRTHMENVV